MTGSGVQTLDLPLGGYHSTQRGERHTTSRTDSIRSNLSTTRWQERIVKLVFERNGGEDLQGIHASFETQHSRNEVVLTRRVGRKLHGKEAKEGNGFYVNVPNKAFDVILTAGHNIVDGPHH